MSFLAWADFSLWISDLETTVLIEYLVIAVDSGLGFIDNCKVTYSDILDYQSILRL